MGSRWRRMVSVFVTTSGCRSGRRCIGRAAMTGGTSIAFAIAKCKRFVSVRRDSTHDGAVRHHRRRQCWTGRP